MSASPCSKISTSKTTSPTAITRNSASAQRSFPSEKHNPSPNPRLTTLRCHEPVAPAHKKLLLNAQEELKKSFPEATCKPASKEQFRRELNAPLAAAAQHGISDANIRRGGNRHK